MSKRVELPSSRHHVLLFDEDYEFLEAQYGRFSDNRTGVSEVIRQMIHKWCLALKARATEQADARGQGQAPQAEKEPTP